jgi:sugar fermentation stimulation protein A
VELATGACVDVHVPNTGTLMSCWAPGVPVQVSPAANPRRKLRWTLERTDMGGGWIGVNTQRPNQVMAEGIGAGRIEPLAGYGLLRREVGYAAGQHFGRVDIALYDGPASEPHGDADRGGTADALVEVKNVTLLEGDRLRFPDAKTERGRKHLALLAHAVRSGMRGVMLFALNRPEGGCFSPAWEIDPAYGEALLTAADAGVELLAVRMRHQDDAVIASDLVPIDLARP